jgi:hypothetical protein
MAHARLAASHGMGKRGYLIRTDYLLNDMLNDDELKARELPEQL